MAPLELPRRQPIHDVHPLTGISIEVFWADTTPRRRGFSPDSPATGPFPTSYAAYRHAISSDGAGAKRRTKI
jgi:hypothetical protein